jgi:[ribosomal protein S5]-alanine N-acetyltransferase
MAVGGPSRALVASDGLIGLRNWDLRDAEWYAACVRDPDIQQFTSESATLTPDQVRSAITALRAGRPGVAGWLICDAATGERLGNIAVSVSDGVGDVSYWIAASARGRGAATRAVLLGASQAFTVMRARTLRLWAHVDNAGSRTVAQRAGFVRDPSRDERREVKGSIWHTVAYTCDRASWERDAAFRG